jgi:large conductance mechanosensitive channel
LAVAVVIGTAFSKIVTAFTEDMIMPLINPLLAMTGKSWREWTIAPEIRIGIF